MAPQTFTRCMDAALFPLRQMGIRILNYLDDWLILAQSQAVLTSHKTLLLSHLVCLGLRVNLPRAYCHPASKIHSWAQLSTQMTATVSAEQATTIQRHVASFREGSARLFKAFQKMLGLMAAASPVLQLGLLHMRPNQFWLKQRVPATAWHHGSHHVTVTLACVSALARWRYHSR